MSPQEVHQQLDVIIGDAAKSANENRNKRILNVMHAFWDSIFGSDADDNISEFKTDLSPEDSYQEYVKEIKKFDDRCLSKIDQFEKNLKHPPDEVIQVGYRCDPIVLHHIVQWFLDKRVHQLRILLQKDSIHVAHHKLDVFLINAIGKVQKFLLSTRDSEAFYRGIPNFLEQKGICLREFKDEYYCHPAGKTFRLSSDYFLSSSGERADSAFSCEHRYIDGRKKYYFRLREYEYFNGIKEFCQSTDERFMDFYNYYFQISSPKKLISEGLPVESVQPMDLSPLTVFEAKKDPTKINSNFASSHDVFFSSARVNEVIPPVKVVTPLVSDNDLDRDEWDQSFCRIL